MEANISQVGRWSFTLNNFDRNCNYADHFKVHDFKVKRCVFGREVGTAGGIPHMQGYLELWRTMRLAHMKKILPRAHWSPARESSLVNYRYCVKENDYVIVGDFSAEEAGSSAANNRDATRPCGIGMIVRGLLAKPYANQVRVSREYSLNYLFYERTTKMIRDMRVHHKEYSAWKKKLLYPWQYQVLSKIMTQNDRSVLWVLDKEGNHGKTFLGLYLSYLYGFQYFNSVLNIRDIVSLINPSSNGIVLDISRACAQSFDYSSLESLKNGVLVSGKYRGEYKRLKSTKLVCFANFYPVYGQLSADRWDILTLGEGDLTNLEKHQIVSPNTQYPCQKPLPLPDLSDDFNLRTYLLDRLPSLNHYEMIDEEIPVVETNEFPYPPAVASTSAVSNFNNEAREERPIVCLIHPNQTAFKKGCPCRQKGNRNRTDEVRGDGESMALRDHTWIIPLGEQAPDTPSRNQAPDTPSRNQVHATPSRNQVHATPSRNQVHATPSRNQVHATPSRNQVHATPSRNQVLVGQHIMHAHGTPSRAQIRGTPSRDIIQRVSSRDLDLEWINATARQSHCPSESSSIPLNASGNIIPGQSKKTKRKSKLSLSLDRKKRRTSIPVLETTSDSDDDFVIISKK